MNELPVATRKASEEGAEDLDPYAALNEGQFVPFFQPLITLRTGQLAGFEVLARWQHPSRGIIPPIRFISVADGTGGLAD